MSKNKNIYIAVQIKKGNEYYAYVIETTDNTNLLSVLNVKGIATANVYNKTKAYEMADRWNKGFMENGNYYFRYSQDGLLGY